MRGARDLPTRDTARTGYNTREQSIETGNTDVLEQFADRAADLPDCNEEVLKPDSGQHPNVMLVVDRSGSMGTSGEWEPTVTAVSSVTAALETSVAFGLMLFPILRAH